jgi:hypothetical protein
MVRRRNPVDQIEFMRNLLAFLLVGAFIGAMGAFTAFTIPQANKDILTYMVGQLSGMAITVLGFYFVSKVGQDALDAKRSDNTGKAFETLNAALTVGKPEGTEEDPIKTQVVNSEESPVAVTETPKASDK